MARVPANNPAKDWVPPAERRRRQKANGHADAGSLDVTPADANSPDASSVGDAAISEAVVGDIVPRDVVLPGPAYDAEQGREICQRVAAGESLKQICGGGKQAELSTVMGWLFLDEIEVFTSQYLDARSARLELMMDEVVAIADDLAALPPQAPIQEVDGDGDDKKPPAPEPAALPEKDRLAIAKLRIETRRWLIDKQLKATSGTDTKETGRLVPSEILFDGVGA